MGGERKRSLSSLYVKGGQKGFTLVQRGVGVKKVSWLIFFVLLGFKISEQPSSKR